MKIIGLREAKAALSAVQLHQLLVLTANTRHFAATGVRHVNPFEVLPE